MKKKVYYERDIHTGTSIGLEYEKYLYQSQSKYQNIEIIYSSKYGNAMYLDGCFMLSEKNQDYFRFLSDANQVLKEIYKDFLKYGTFYAAGNIENAQAVQPNYFIRTNPDDFYGIPQVEDRAKYHPFNYLSLIHI